MIWTFDDLDAGLCSVADVGSQKPQQEPPALDDEVPHSGDPVATRWHIDRRLHAAMEAQARQAEKGDVQAARALVAICERRAKILGLDAPKEVQIDVTRNRANIRELPTAELERMLIEGSCTREPRIEDHEV